MEEQKEHGAGGSETAGTTSVLVAAGDLSPAFRS